MLSVYCFDSLFFKVCKASYCILWTMQTTFQSYNLSQGKTDIIHNDVSADYIALKMRCKGEKLTGGFEDFLSLFEFVLYCVVFYVDVVAMLYLLLQLGFEADLPFMYIPIDVALDSNKTLDNPNNVKGKILFYTHLPGVICCCLPLLCTENECFSVLQFLLILDECNFIS